MTNGAVTKYYFSGSQRIATLAPHCVWCSAGVRTNGTLTYLLSDHLGSTNLTTDASGNLLSQMKYKAWGEVRSSTGYTPTDYTYKGQYSHTADFGLMFYNAGWYDPTLGRFAQADSIVPGGIQGLDRYGYVNNNPLRYTDPTGHMCREDGKHCEGSSNIKTKVGNIMVAGDGIQRGNGRPPATPCLQCHSPVTPTPTLIPTGTPTIPPEFLSTPTPCLGPRSACLPTATSIPTSTPTPSSYIYPTDSASHSAIVFGVSGSATDGMTSYSNSAGVEILCASDDSSCGLFSTHGYGTGVGESGDIVVYAGGAWNVNTASDNGGPSQSDSLVLGAGVAVQFTLSYGADGSGSFTVGIGPGVGASYSHSWNETVQTWP